MVVINIREDLIPQFKMGGTFRADVPAIDGKDIEFRIYYILSLIHIFLMQRGLAKILYLFGTDKESVKITTF